MNQLIGELVERVKHGFSSLLHQYRTKKNDKVIVIGLVFFFFFLILSLINHAFQTSKNIESSIPNHTEIASTIYAEIYLRTDIAATIFAQITPATTDTPIPTTDYFANILSKYPCNDPVFTKIQGQVSKVLDVDILEIMTNNEYKTIRYLGFDSSTNTDFPLTAQTKLSAMMKNQELVFGQEILVLTDNSLDDNGNLLGYVFTMDTFVNLEMLKAGFFKADPNNNLVYSSFFIDAENEARSSNLGIWAIPTEIPTLFPTKTLVPTNTSVPALNCHPSYPDVCIPYPPPDLDCDEIPYRRFRVLLPDPHGFDRDHDGIGCESN